eukprot:g18825.t1
MQALAGALGTPRPSSSGATSSSTSSSSTSSGATSSALTTTSGSTLGLGSGQPEPPTIEVHLPPLVPTPQGVSARARMTTAISAALKEKAVLALEGGCGLGKTRATMDAINHHNPGRNRMAVDWATRTWLQVDQLFREAQQHFAGRIELHLTRHRCCINDAVRQRLEQQFAEQDFAAHVEGCDSTCPFGNAAAAADSDIEDLAGGGRKVVTLSELEHPKPGVCGWRRNLLRNKAGRLVTGSTSGGKSTVTRKLHLMTHKYLELALDGVGHRSAAATVIDEAHAYPGTFSSAVVLNRSTVLLSGTLFRSMYASGPVLYKEVARKFDEDARARMVGHREEAFRVPVV